MKKIPQHKYAINAKMLGDFSVLPWTNLGLWNNPTYTYQDACQQMACHLGQALKLNSQDSLLDLGCGFGASLLCWQNQFHITQMTAVELQNQCVEQIKSQKIQSLKKVYQGSFLKIQSLLPHQTFDVIVCIDALYHHKIKEFLESITYVRHAKTRLGFHCLVLNFPFNELSKFQKLKYQYLLKLADIELQNLMTIEQMSNLLQQHGYQYIKQENLTKAVFKGFSTYIKKTAKSYVGLDGLKIRATAKLCDQLYKDGLISYMQIIAQ